MKTNLEKYKEAEKLLVQNTSKAVLNGKPKVIKIDDTSFYYPKEKYDGDEIEIEFTKVDLFTGTQVPLFNHTPLKEALKENAIAETINFKKIELYENGIEFEIDKRQYFYDFVHEQLEDNGFVSPQNEICSDEYRVFVQDYNLFVESCQNGEIRQLTFDGEKDNGYGIYAEYSESIKRKINHDPIIPGVLFSHDGQKILTYKLDQRTVKELYIIESFDNDNLESIRPRLHTYKCPFPEDKEVPLAALTLIDLKSGKVTAVDCEPFTTGYGLFTEHSSVAKWSADDSFITATWVSRGSKEAKLLMIDPSTGHADVIVHETTDTFLNYGTHGELDGFNEYPFSNFITSDKKLAIWQSERDDFERYFAYDIKTKKCLGAITPANIMANSIINVDEKEKKITFIATNLEHCSDPYYECCCSVDFDGKNFLCLSNEDAYHTIQWLDDAFVDTYSRVDLPPVSNLKNKNGEVIKELVSADITKLMSLGYVIPERFSVKASDGVTDLYGIMIKPIDLEEGQTVPYIDHMYGGMQCYYVPKQFTWDHEMKREIYGGLESYAHLGIAGIMIDGLGTPGRGKKLHNISYENIHGCAGLKDHVFIAQQLKEKFPFIDINRVGIWGNSGGGCATSRAMLEYPDYFKVGVSSAGNHDQRMYNNGWTERYYGLYNKEIYLKGDNTVLADNLKGKLFIVHGAMDDNVAMSQSIRLIDALIEADKDFDFLVLPRSNHNVPASPYFVRKKMDYFMKNLLNEEPPLDYHFDI